MQLRRRKLILAAVIAVFFAVSLAHAGGTKPVTLESFGNGLDAMVIDLPRGYEVTRDRGPDFDVHRIVSTEDRNARLGIYVGYAPQQFRPANAISEPGHLANGVEVTWYRWTEQEDGQSVYHAETRAERLPGLGNLVFHMFMSARDESKLRTLQNAASTLRAAGPPGETHGSDRSQVPFGA